MRDITSEDVDAIARYWFGSSDEFLDCMGIDRKRLGTVEDTRKRFQRAMRTGRSDQQSFALAITLDNEFIGYTLLNRYAPEENYSHWHITNPDLRGTGISTALYPHRIKTYFDLVPIERLIHQTRTRNIAVNRMLDKYVPISQTCQIEKPDGVALPGEFNLRYAFRRDLEKFFAKAVELHGAA